MKKSTRDEQFYPLALSMLTKLRQADLTGAEWKLWSYLIETMPANGESVEVDIPKVLADCGISKATFDRAKVKFQAIGCFEFQEPRRIIRWR